MAKDKDKDDTKGEGKEPVLSTEPVKKQREREQVRLPEPSKKEGKGTPKDSKDKNRGER